MRGLLAALVVGACSPAWAHDLGLDLSLNGTAASATNPRSGAASLSVSGSYDFSDKWSGFFTAMYLRDFATQTAGASSPGSNVFLLSLGGMFSPSEHWMFMASVNGSPPTTQRSAQSTTLTTRTGTAYTLDGVLVGINSSLGGTLLASWASAGFSNWEHTVDVSAATTYFSSYQNFQVSRLEEALARRNCPETTAENALCRVVLGTTAPLVQVRVGATYTATLFTNLDLSLDGAGYLFDKNPSSIGVFSLGGLGRDPVGLGTSTAPWLATGRLSATYRFTKVSVLVSYQLGAYTGDYGMNHLARAKVSWKVNDRLRLTLSGLVQADVDGQGLVNRGGTLTAGALMIFP